MVQIIFHGVIGHFKHGRQCRIVNINPIDVVFLFLKKHCGVFGIIERKGQNAIPMLIFGGGCKNTEIPHRFGDGRFGLMDAGSEAAKK